MGIKTCIKCGETKQEELFVKRGSRRRNICSICKNAENRESHRKLHGTKLKDKQELREVDPKRCKVCNTVKPLAEYNLLNEGAHRSKCKSCQKEHAAGYYQNGGKEVGQKYRHDNIDRHRTTARELNKKYKLSGQQKEWSRKHVLKQYGLTLDCYDKMFAEQDGKCAICGTTDPGCNKTVFYVDHDHDTGAVRSLLCMRCNTGLGHFKDDQTLLTAAIDYLERHKSLVSSQRGEKLCLGRANE